MRKVRLNEGTPKRPELRDDLAVQEITRRSPAWRRANRRPTMPASRLDNRCAWRGDNMTRILGLLAVAALIAGMSATAADSGVGTHAILARQEIAPGHLPYRHPADLCELRNGTLLAIYNGGASEAASACPDFSSSRPTGNASRWWAGAACRDRIRSALLRMRAEAGPKSPSSARAAWPAWAA
jgi:hypothetical protein